MRLTIDEAEKLVAQALDELPEEFFQLLDNVAVVVE
jgi:predicted Zn-dependent protease with MMP-like domain